MKTTMITLAAGLLLASAGLAAAADLTPKLAAKVKPAAAGYETTTEKLATSSPTPLFSDVNEQSDAVGQLDKAGEPVQVLAKVRGWDWYLVGKDGVGVGYVPRALLRPAAG